MKVSITIVSGLALLAYGLSLAAQSGSSTASSYPRGAAAVPLLEEVWQFATQRIYPRHLATRFESTRLDAMQANLAANADLPLADVLNPLLDELGVSHTRFFDRRHQAYYMLRSLFSTRSLDTPSLYTTGVQLDDRDPGRVQAVLDGSVAAAAGIQRGDRIVTVDGMPFRSLLQWQHARPVRLGVSREDARLEVVLEPTLQGMHRAMLRATRASRQVFECGPRRIAYVHLWSGTNAGFLDVLHDAVREANTATLDGFVLDLRDGYGGAWWEYLDPFFSDRSHYFVATSFGPGADSETLQVEPQANADAWQGPLAVLINGGTRSGKEALAYQFRKTGRARVFGTTTRGAFSGGLGAFADRDADYILYLAVREFQLDQQVIEGVGVAPDVVLPDSGANDAPLGAALQHLGCGTGNPA